MLEPHWCPAEGCDYPHDKESASLAAVRSHINAMSDGDHDWPTLKPVLRGQDEGGADPSEDDDQQDEGIEQTETPENGETEQPDEGGESLVDGPTEDNDQQDEGVEQTEADENSESDQQDTPVVSDDELERQRQSSERPTETSDDAPLPTPSDGGGGIPIPVSTTTVFMGAGLFLMFALLYLYVRGGSQSSKPEQTDDEGATDQDVSDAVSDEEVTLLDE